jgi:hypothetical protein
MKAKLTNQIKSLFKMCGKEDHCHRATDVAWTLAEEDCLLVAYFLGDKDFHVEYANATTTPGPFNKFVLELMLKECLFFTRTDDRVLILNANTAELLNNVWRMAATDERRRQNGLLGKD